MANGLAAHSQDFDDTHWTSTLHPSAVVWGALLAEDVGARADAEVTAAYGDAIALISDLASFVCPWHIRRGWHSTSTVGALAATAAVSRARGHDLATTVHAVKIAGTLIGGLRGNNASSAKALHAGRAGATAVLACDVAGLDGFEGHLSLDAVGNAFGLVSTDGSSAPSTADITFKPYPTCSGTHAAIEAALALADSATPRQALVRVPAIVGEETHKHWPSSLTSARLSLPFVVAAAFTYGRVDEDALVRGLSDPEVRILFDRIDVEVAPPIPNEPYRSAATLQVTWPDRSATRTVECPAGEPRRPMTTAELEAKMRHQAAAVWTGPRQEALLSAARRFAAGGSATDLVDLAARADRTGDRD